LSGVSGKEKGRGPDQELIDFQKSSRQPDAESQPNLGEPHRIQSRKSGDLADAVFLFGSATKACAASVA
jgi:hypothetical protein